TLATHETRGATNAADKILRLARFVQQQCTYKAIEFGRRARVPNTAAQTLQNRYGDCKDQSVLLQQFLRAAGLPAHLALVHHSRPIQKDIPSLDQFNHMIVFVPGPGNGRFLDCTDKSADLAATSPYALSGQDALILDPENPRFITLPEAPTASGLISIAREIRLVNQTDAALRDQLTFTGVNASSLRYYLKAVDPAQRKAFAQRQLISSSRPIEIQDLQVDNLDDPQAPLLIRMSTLIRGQFQLLDDQLTGTLPAPWEHATLKVEPIEARQTPFQLRYPIAFHVAVTLLTPDGFAPPSPEPLQRALNDPFATCRTTGLTTNRTTRLDLNFQQLPGRFAAPNYAAYRAATDQALQLLEPKITFKKSIR
ncbi:MAG TPA: transglutaminase-like domain-containing protein, partial [Verrucomicrobiae bacterium]